MRARRAVAAQGLEAMRQIGVVPAEAAFADQDGNLGGKQCGAFGCGVDHHAGEPRRQRQPAQFPPFLGDAAIRVDGADLNEQRLCLGKGQARRRIEEGKLFGRSTPCREVERKTGKVGGEDFRAGIGFERRGLRLVPEPVADARLGAAGAAAALVGRRARHAHGLEPRHADIGFVARHAGKPAVDDDADAFDGDRGLGNRGGEHDFAAAACDGGDGAVLLIAGKHAVERNDVACRLEPALEQRLGAADLRRSGKEREKRARLRARCAPDRVSDLRLDRPRIAADIAGLDWKGAAFGGDHRGLVEERGDAGSVDRRRHDEEPQILA
jgi:hypothetical protein